MGVEKGWGAGLWLFNTLRTLLPLEILFQVFSFKEVCTVSAAKLFLSSSPNTKDLRILVSDARLHQLQHWLQLLIKLLAVRARNAETRLLLNRPFWPCCLMIWCIRKLLLTNQTHLTKDIHSQQWCPLCLWREGG